VGATAIWTGSKLIVWGGTSSLNDRMLYNLYLLHPEGNPPRVRAAARIRERSLTQALGPGRSWKRRALPP
jgi:hypothetical protein